MDLDNLLNNTLEEFLVECVSDKIEDVLELPKMLKDIGYLEKKQELIDKTTKCEMLDVDNWSVEKYSLSEDEIHINYEIDFILQTFIDSEFIWRIQGFAQAEFSIPYTGSQDLSVFASQGSDFFGLYEKYKDLVRFKNIVYTDIECDTLYL